MLEWYEGKQDEVGGYPDLVASQNDGGDILSDGDRVVNTRGSVLNDIMLRCYFLSTEYPASSALWFKLCKKSH